jgi:hypothetical protein
VIVGSFLLPLRTVSLRLLPAFVLSAAAFELTAAVCQSLIKAEYATQAKRRYYSLTVLHQRVCGGVRVPCAVCRVPCAVCRVPCACHAIS